MEVPVKKGVNATANGCYGASDEPAKKTEVNGAARKMTTGDTLAVEDAKRTMKEVHEVPEMTDASANNVGTMNDKSPTGTKDEDPDVAANANPCGMPPTICVPPKKTHKKKSGVTTNSVLAAGPYGNTG